MKINVTNINDVPYAVSYEVVIGRLTHVSEPNVWPTSWRLGGAFVGALLLVIWLKITICGKTLMFEFC